MRLAVAICYTAGALAQRMAAFADLKKLRLEPAPLALNAALTPAELDWADPAPAPILGTTSHYVTDTGTLVAPGSFGVADDPTSGRIVSAALATPHPQHPLDPALVDDAASEHVREEPSADAKHSARALDWADAVEEATLELNVSGLPVAQAEDWPLPSPRLLSQPAPLPPAPPPDAGVVISHAAIERNATLSDTDNSAETTEWGARPAELRPIRRPPPSPPYSAPPVGIAAPPPPLRRRATAEEAEWRAGS